MNLNSLALSALAFLATIAPLPAIATPLSQYDRNIQGSFDCRSVGATFVRAFVSPDRTICQRSNDEGTTASYVLEYIGASQGIDRVGVLVLLAVDSPRENEIELMLYVPVNQALLHIATNEAGTRFFPSTASRDTYEDFRWRINNSALLRSMITEGVMQYRTAHYHAQLPTTASPAPASPKAWGSTRSCPGGFILTGDSCVRNPEVYCLNNNVCQPTHSSSGPVRVPTSSGSGRCQFPSDRAADGSRCGGRAASVRPGGR